MPISLVLGIANDPNLSETGGAHATKGVDFQRYWAIAHMLDLEAEGKDFLLLFETIQDICELDSPDTPTKAHIFQIKKRDRNEWTWKDLTSLPRKKATKGFNKGKFEASAIGKLLRCVEAMASLQAEGHFVSNAGCNLELAGGHDAATSEASKLSALSNDLSDSLTHGISLFLGTTQDLSRLSIRKVAIHPDSPQVYVVGKAVEFLTQRSPKHAGQAQSLVVALFAKISPLGRHTDTCASAEELVKQRGFSATNLKRCLESLEQVPDASDLLNDFLSQLQQEGLDFFRVADIRREAAAILSRRVSGLESKEARELRLKCRTYMETHPMGTPLLPHLESAYETLRATFPAIKRPAMWAQLALEGVDNARP